MKEGIEARGAPQLPHSAVPRAFLGYDTEKQTQLARRFNRDDAGWEKTPGEPGTWDSQASAVHIRKLPRPRDEAPGRMIVTVLVILSVPTRLLRLNSSQIPTGELFRTPYGFYSVAGAPQPWLSDQECQSEKTCRNMWAQWPVLQSRH